MNSKKYKSPRALEMAVRDAARNSNQDTGQAIDNFYHDRLLERVFSEQEPSFVLKGGRGMLARTVNARHTRDTDFLYRGVDLNEAVSELERLAAVDLDDFLEFRLVSTSKIAEDQEYRDGYRIEFVPVFGGKRLTRKISIDLVVNQVYSDDADEVVPASRLEVKGLPVFNYRVYRVTSAIADKVCATMQKYSGGRASSRIRDLADLSVYLTTETFDGEELSNKIALERQLRKEDPIDAFHVPENWMELYGHVYEKIAAEASLPVEYRDVAAAERLVKTCVDGALSGEVDGLSWSPDLLQWVPNL